jgi:hypothetical protein
MHVPFRKHGSIAGLASWDRSKEGLLSFLKK